MLRAFACEEIVKAPRVVERVQHEHMRKIRAANSAGRGTRAGRDHQTVVVHALAAVEHHLAPRMLYGGDLSRCAHLNIAFLLEPFRSVENQILDRADLPLDVIRQPAGAQGNRISLFKNHDFERRIQAPRARRRAQARRNSADDD